jgi:hypothetical protein
MDSSPKEMTSEIFAKLACTSRQAVCIEGENGGTELQKNFRYEELRYVSNSARRLPRDGT